MGPRRAEVSAKFLFGGEGRRQGAHSKRPAAVEYIAGAYAGSSSLKPPVAKWPNAFCVSWCDRAHRAGIPSPTSTARIATVNGLPVTNTASAQDFARSAYMLTQNSKETKCILRSFAHRSHKHILVNEWECTRIEGEGEDDDVVVVLEEPGPSHIKTFDNQTILGAPLRELIAQQIDSKLDGVVCNTFTARELEDAMSPRVVVAECHDDCDKRKVALGQGVSSSFHCISARYTSVDDDWDGSTPLVHLALKGYLEANASASTLFETHVAAMEELLIPGCVHHHHHHHHHSRHQDQLFLYIN